MPDPTTPKNKKARYYAGLAAFYAMYCQTIRNGGLFPLDGGGGLARDIVSDAIYAADLVDNATRYPL